MQSCFSALSAFDHADDRTDDSLTDSEKKRQQYAGEIQIQMAQLLSLQCENSKKEADLDETLKKEEDFILAINKIYRLMMGLDPPEKVQSARKEIQRLRALTLKSLSNKV